MKCSIVLLVGLAWAVPVNGQATAYPRAADVSSIDGIVKAFYDVVSGPAGEAPDRARDESLHFAGAFIGMSRPDRNGKATFTTMDLKGYYERFGGTRSAPFFEWEIHRVVQQFGNIAQVWTTYVTSDAPNGAPTGRGINSLHLYFDGARWWITGWIDERERPDSPIPAAYLPGGTS